jgi:D-glycero-D-manno-heptose 1,7-bisphosphate phosphatase
MKSPALFLDRDGTINEEVDFLTNPDHLHLISGVTAALRDAKAMGFKLFVITNQSGIARGFLTEERLQEIHTALNDRLTADGAAIDRIYYCPHHPELGSAPYRTVCECRKPKPGMIQQAVREYAIDPARSFVIGDRMIDCQAANAAGIPAIMVLTGYGADELALCREQQVPVFHVAETLPDAVQFIKKLIHQTQPSLQ